MRKKLIIFMIFTLGYLVPASAYGFVKKITFRYLSGNSGSMTVYLKKPAFIVVYYDSQRPSNPGNLYTFWYYEKCRKTALKHSFLLKRLQPKSTYYFRIERKIPAGAVTHLMQWKMNRKRGFIVLK